MGFRCCHYSYKNTYWSKDFFLDWSFSLCSFYESCFFLNYEMVFLGLCFYWFKSVRVFLLGFFISVNVTFLPMHTLRLDGMPRRYITYAGFMSNYNRFCSFRALSSIIFLFIGLAALNPSMSAHFAFTMLALNTDPSF